ncbi:MAG: hypothetical protein KDA88_22205 [Planctomycetaceae bacterium]|nr:hypothetical protein [Planctomycetaceae bacterium]MCB9951368.1 hypothetical protein [Planctomycetaceae bacterium]
MSDSDFSQLESASSQGTSALFEQLESLLREKKDYHKLFDARVLKKKAEMGLPLARPSSLQDVPEDHRKEVEAVYVEAAREAGGLFLAEGDITNAWMYLQVIREPEKVKETLDKLSIAPDDYERLDRMVQIALYQGVHPVKGVEWMLKAHGICSTITTLDQVLHTLNAEQRAECAKLMVRTLYTDVVDSVRRHVEARMPMLPPDEPLTSLIAGRDWLFEGGNYHIDVSHLNSVVRFSRSIEPPADELDLALQLAEYGSKLDPQLQYGGDPPFDDFYPAHAKFLSVLLDRNRDSALQYFRDKLDQEPDEQDKPVLAYVLVDLLMRCEKLDEAVEVGAKYLSQLGEEVSISFDELCQKAGRLDALQQVRKDQGDLVGFASALLRKSS